MGMFSSDYENEMNFDYSNHKWNVIQNYKKLQEKNPNHDLLKFGKVMTKGLIFKKEDFEFSEKHHKEYLKKYENKKGETYPMPIEKYSKDLEKVLKEK